MLGELSHAAEQILLGKGKADNLKSEQLGWSSAQRDYGKLSNLKEVFLHKTSVSGPIPSELGKLSLLDELLLDGTRLNGTMPPEICKLRSKNLHDLRANCHDGGTIQCDHPTCCTSCRS
jgi:hypothetical protein